MLVDGVCDGGTVPEEGACREEGDCNPASHGQLLSDPDAVAEATGPLEDVRDLLSLPFVEGLAGLLQRLDEGDAKLGEEAVVAREGLFERGVVDEAAGDDAGEVFARLLRLFAENAAVLAKLVEGTDDGLLLTRCGVESLEDAAQEPAPPAAAEPLP